MQLTGMVRAEGAHPQEAGMTTSETAERWPIATANEWFSPFDPAQMGDPVGVVVDRLSR